MNKILTTLALLLMSYTVSIGQTTTEALAGSDKINVVIGVLSIIFIGLIVTLFMLDRRIARLEKQKREHNG